MKKAYKIQAIQTFLKDVLTPEDYWVISRSLERTERRYREMGLKLSARSISRIQKVLFTKEELSERKRIEKITKRNHERSKQDIQSHDASIQSRTV